MKKRKKESGIDDKKLLKEWRDAVLERAGYHCEYPDCRINSHQLHSHHLYSRRHVKLRYDLRNGICLCAVHHTMGSFSAHNDPDFKNIIVACKVRTEEQFAVLRALRNEIQKNTPEFRKECHEKLKPYLHGHDRERPEIEDTPF